MAKDSRPVAGRFNESSYRPPGDPLQYNGLDRLMVWDGLPGGPTFYRVDGRTAAKWAPRRTLELWQAIALFSDLDPDSLDTDSNVARALMDTYKDTVSTTDNFALWLATLDTACIAILSGDLPCDSRDADPRWSVVRIEVVAEWARRVSLPQVGGWETFRWEPMTSKWPWGDYTTPRLDRVLLPAGRHCQSAWERGETITTKRLVKLMTSEGIDDSNRVLNDSARLLIKRRE